MDRAIRKEMLEFLNLISLNEIHRNKALKKQTSFLKKYLAVSAHDWDRGINDKECPFPFIIQQERK